MNTTEFDHPYGRYSVEGFIGLWAYNINNNNFRLGGKFVTKLEDDNSVIMNLPDEVSFIANDSANN